MPLVDIKQRNKHVPLHTMLQVTRKKNNVNHLKGEEKYLIEKH